MVREASSNDLCGLLELYLHLHEVQIPEDNEHLRDTWNQILSNPNHHVIIYEKDGKIVSSCICVIIPNLTRNVRPFALIEYVVTHGEYRNRGYAGQCLSYAKEIAASCNCYKMMLVTGSKDPKTHHFYESCGYSRKDKTAYVQLL